jgi:hypothetical protein
MKIKQCHKNRIFPTSNGQVVERDTYSILLTQKRPDNTISKSRNRTKAEIEQKTGKSSNKFHFSRNTLHREEKEHAVNLRLHQSEHRIRSFKKIANLLTTANADGINRGLQ